MESYYNFHYLPQQNHLSANVMPSKFVYVKQDFVNYLAGPSKVLVNPNFQPKVQVHLNPNFKSQRTDVKRNVYVNPNMFIKEKEPPLKDAKAKPVENKSVYVNPNMFKKEKEMLVENFKRTPVESTKITPVENKDKIVSTRTKLIRVKSNTTSVKTTDSIKTRFKIVRSSNSPKQKSKVKNKAKCNSYQERKIAMNVWKNPKYSTAKKVALKNSIKDKHRKLKLQYINISGVLYRKSANTLKLAKRIENPINSHKKHSKQRLLHLLSVKDSRYTSLKKVRAGGVTFKRNVFVNSPINKARLSSSAKFKSVQLLANKMKKSNLPCPFYRKFGRCKGKEKGTCIRIHNPDQISLCPRFLQGMCNNEKCLLSHKVSAEKMPTCKFFLEGLCSKDNCPYIHVKINVKADVCQDFLQGFCSKADKCEKRHQFLCPEYEREGKCSRKACTYPHVNIGAESKHINKVTTNVTNLMKIKKVQSNSEGEKNKQVEDNVAEKNARYYKETERLSPEKIKDANTVDVTDVLRVRPKLGDLPSFIPLSDKDL